MRVPAFNPFDPVGSWLRGLIDNTIDSIVSMFTDAINMIVSMSSFSFTDSWFIRTYQYTFSVAFLVGLPMLLIMTFAKTASGSISPSEMWNTLAIRVPKFIVLCMFGPAIGCFLGMLIAGLDRSIIEFSFGGTAEEMSESFTNSLVSAFTGNPGGLIMSLLLALLILLAVIVFFITSLLLFVLTIAVAVFFPLAQLFDLTTSRRGITRKYLTIFMFMLALMPISLLLFGLFMQMFAANADAGTILGAVDDAQEGTSSIRQIALLLISAIALFIPALGPLALLKFSTAFVGGGSGGKGGGGGGGGGAGTLGGGGPQGAAKGAAVVVATGGVGAAAGAAGGGGGAVTGAASSGAGATASGAAKSGSSAAASRGPSTAAQKASAAGRIADSARANHQRRTQTTAQTAAMASYQLDGVPERRDDD